MPEEKPLTTVEAIKYLIGQDMRGEIWLDVKARSTFTRYLQEETEEEVNR